MTRDELIAALHAPRVPASLASLQPGALIAAFGLGLLISLVSFALLRPVLARRLRPATPAELLARLRALPAAERPLAAARIFTALGAPLPEPIRAALYRPGLALEPREIGSALDAAWAAAGREARRAADA